MPQRWRLVAKTITCLCDFGSMDPSSAKELFPPKCHGSRLFWSWGDGYHRQSTDGLQMVAWTSSGKKAFALPVTIISLIPIILIISICNDHYLIADQLGKLPPSLCSDWPTSQLTPLPQFPSATSSSTATTSTSSVVVLLVLQLVPLYSSPLTTIKSWHLSLWKAGNGGRWTPNPQVVSLPDLLQPSSGQALWKGKSCLILIYQDRRLQSYESQLTYIFLLVHIWSQGHNIWVLYGRTSRVQKYVKDVKF